MSSKRRVSNGRIRWEDARSYVAYGGSRADSCSSGMVGWLGVWSFSGSWEMVGRLNLRGNRIMGCEWRAEIICS